jgi:glycerate 2-kinase
MMIEATPHNRAGELALGIYERVLHDVRSDRLMRRAVSLDDGNLRIEARSPGNRLSRASVPLAEFSRIFVCGAGKASIGMASALEAMLGDRISGGLVVTKRGDESKLERIEVIQAGHPVPDEASLDAGQRMFDLASSLPPDDLLLFCLSGGASSLMELPVEGLSLETLRSISDGLLRQRFDIRQVNSVRSCFSRIKSGGLARAANSSQVVCFVLSDVLGNDLSVIGSGPFYDAERQGDPYTVMRTAGLLDLLPSSIQTCLRKPTPDNIDHDRIYPRHVIVGSNRTALESAELAAVQAGLDAKVHDVPLTGDARAHAAELASLGEPGVCHIFGGEPVVSVRGEGKGGRCQELACAAAELIDGDFRVAILAVGTDGTDGPTDAAGALVDGHTLARATQKGVSASEVLSRSDSYSFHEAAGTLIRTGPTQSNVNDVFLVVKV